jgi:predicted nucleotidyltransferase
MKTSDQILSILRTELEKHSEILFAYVFGSVIDSASFKDVDVGVYVAGPDRLADGFAYAFAMSGELERLIGCRVDVILMNTAPDHMIHSISSGKLILNRDDDRRVVFLAASWSRYFDVQIIRRAYLHAVAGESSAHERS